MSYHPTRRARPAPRPRGALGGLLDVVELPPRPAEGAPDEQVALLRRIAAAQVRFTQNDERFRILQIGAILAIPLAGRIYNWVLSRRAR